MAVPWLAKVFHEPARRLACPITGWQLWTSLGHWHVFILAAAKQRAFQRLTFGLSRRENKSSTFVVYSSRADPFCRHPDPSVWKILKNSTCSKPTSQLTILRLWGLAHIESSGVWGLLICKQICLLSSARRAEKNGPYKPLAFNSPGQVVVAESNRFFAPQASSHRPLYLTRPVTKRQKNSSKFLTSWRQNWWAHFILIFYSSNCPPSPLCPLHRCTAPDTAALFFIGAPSTTETNMLISSLRLETPKYI